MAGLNTLRTKGGWFLTIIILLALLAFILGDMAGSGSRRDPVVGVINGAKVKYTEFVAERSAQDAMMQGGGEQASEQAYARTWSELVNRNALMPGFDMLGLTVSKAERVDMTSGVGGGYVSPVIEQFFRNPETGAFDVKTLENFLGNMTDAELPMWQTIIKQANDERIFSKYGTLVAGGLYVNKLEVDQAVKGENETYSARVGFKAYASVSDSTVEVGDLELRAYYKEHRARYRREASRGIEYVVFDILPSSADMEAGRAKVDELAAGFAASDDPAAFAMLNSDDKSAPVFVREDQLDVALDGVPVQQGETFTMSRLAERRMLPDSVGFRAIVLAPESAVLADSLAGVANSGNFADLATRYSVQDMGSEPVVVDPLMMGVGGLSDALIEAPVGSVRKVDGGDFLVVLNVVSKSVPVSKVRVATVKHTVHASAATHAEVTGRAREFYAAVEGGVDFSKQATEMSLPKRVAHIADTDRSVEGLENSLPLVHWAFSNKQGAVMEPEELNRDYIIVPRLTEVTQKGVAPFEKVSEQIRSLLVQRKKGEMLAAQMDDVALDTTVEGVKYALYAVPEFGFEPRLVGAICSGVRGGRSKPVVGAQGVYVFEVTDVLTEDAVDAAGAKVRLESMAGYFMNNALMNALYEKSNIVDNRAKIGL